MSLPEPEKRTSALPREERAEEPEEPAERYDGEPVSPPPDEPSSTSLGALFRALFWFLVAILGVVLVAGLIWMIRERHGDREASAAPAGAPDFTAGLTAPLSDDERFADEGRFAEAIHVLLLRAQRILARSRTLGISLTSREILRTTDLAECPRTDLAALVRAVEISRFGGGEVGHLEYQECRACYGRLESALEAG